MPHEGIEGSVRKVGVQPEEDKGYSWQDTYGDMVTLLLCFFVLLYSFSSLDTQKWEKIVSALSGTGEGAVVTAFDEVSVRQEAIENIDAMVNLDNRGEDESGEAQYPLDMAFDELYKNITEYIRTNELQGELSAIRTESSIVVRFSEMALFDSGEAEILPGNEDVVRHVVTMISENIDAVEMIDIEGHTDNVPISSLRFEDNWDLSAKRATNMLRKVLDMELIDAEKLSATGYAEYHPVASNDTPEGRRLNRRVDFVLQKRDISE